MAGLQPWGRLTNISKEPAQDSDHIYLKKRMTKIGRNAKAADVVIENGYVSGVHCVVTLQGRHANGTPIVLLEDKSRNGIYVNEQRVDKATGVQLEPDAVIHLFKPGATPQSGPIVFKFEILDGQSAESDRRIAHVEESRDVRMASPPRAPSRVTPTLEQLTGKRKRRAYESTAEDMAVDAAGKRKKTGSDSTGEEMEIEVTRSVSGGSPKSGSIKRRRDVDMDDDEYFLSSNSWLQKNNDELRDRVGELLKSEMDLKERLALCERELANAKDEVQTLLENKTMMQGELDLKGQRLADREQEVERVRQERDAIQVTSEQLRLEVARATSEGARQAQIIAEMTAYREKLEMDMTNMTAQFEAGQNKHRMLEEQIKALRADNSRLAIGIESAQTRSEHVEEGKRGIHEENSLLRGRLIAIQNLFKGFDSLTAKGKRLAVLEVDQSIIAPELEDLQRSDNSILSSEQSQPAPTQDNYFPETQQDDDDQEQTLDPEAAAAEAGLVVSTGVGPFSGFKTAISLRQSISVDLLDLSDQQQPHSTDISQDDTPAGYTDGKSSQSQNSTLSSQSSSSKTPPAPPLPRLRAISDAKTTASQEVEETKGEEPTAEADAKKEADPGAEADDEQTGSEEQKEAKAEAEAEAEADEAAEADAEEGGEDEDKENTPVKPDSAGSVSAVDAKPPSQKPGREGWLQMVVNNDDDKSDQISNSEGGVFDDETQLSSD